MAVITSNGTGGGDWSNGATWIGGVVPGAGDRAVIQAGDVVYIDGNITIGDGSTSTSVYAVDCAGELVWRNEAGDAAASWTFTVNGHMRFNDGRWYIGTEDNSRFGSKSVGPIPTTRTATVLFSMAYYHYINWIGSSCHFEVWGAENYHQDTPPNVSGQSVDSASDYTSFIDAARIGEAANVWRGAWLEITDGTNKGEKREITAFDTATGKISWSSNQPMLKKCDSTTVYSITHNYQRALLQSDVSAGAGVTIILDRPANWQTGDYIVIGTGSKGYNSGTNPEKVQITKISLTQYTCNLADDHKAEDMVIHCTRNVVFDCTLTGSYSNRGYYFNFSTNVGIKLEWCAFEEAGYSSNAILRYGSSTKSPYPMLKSIYFEGWIDSSYYSTSPGVYVSSSTGWDGPTEDFLIDNLHGYRLQTLLEILNVNPKSANWPLERSEKFSLKNLTLVGSWGGSSYALIQVPANLSLQLQAYNIWYDGRYPTSTGRQGHIIRGNAFCLNGFRCYNADRSAYLFRSSVDRNVNLAIELKNGVSIDPGSGHFYFNSPFSWKGLIENVVAKGVASKVGGIICYKAGHLTLFLRNNKYNSLGSGIYLSETNVGYIYEFDGEYGVETANNNNVIYYGNTGNDLNTIRYVSYNTKYNTPVNGADPTIPFRIANYPHQSLGAIDSMEAHNPILDDVPSPSIALVNGTTVVENVEHPTNPRSQSNIKLKITPFVAVADSFVNLRIPFLAYAQQDQTVTVSVYLRKNVSQEEGTRPKLWVMGNGIYECSEMSDVNDTWEQVSITYTARYDGAVTAWLTCRNNYKYAKSDSLGSDGEEAVQGTVIVYADELNIEIV